VALTEIDRNLLKRCLAEEPGAWKDFVDRFIGLFIHVINHVGHSRSVRLSSDDVDDLCADVFVALLADDFAILRRFRGKSSLATYLTVIARRIVVREVSRRRMAEALGHVNAHQSSIEQAHASASQDVQRIESAEQVEQMLQRLPERDADIVRQFHLEGRSYGEISSRLGIPENTIGPTLSRARETLSFGTRRQSQCLRDLPADGQLATGREFSENPRPADAVPR
jgi:RNA polymerase sigma-70 factor (ECF subfamily)